METETTTWSEFLNGGKAIAEQMLASEERSKSKRQWESQSEIGVGKLTVCVRSFEITEFTRLISSTRIAKPVLDYDGHQSLQRQKH